MSKQTYRSNAFHFIRQSVPKWRSLINNSSWSLRILQCVCVRVYVYVYVRRRNSCSVNNCVASRPSLFPARQNASARVVTLLWRLSLEAAAAAAAAHATDWVTDWWLVFMHHHHHQLISASRLCLHDVEWILRVIFVDFWQWRAISQSNWIHTTKSCFVNYTLLRGDSWTEKQQTKK